QLLDAVDAGSKELADATAGLTAAVADTRGDLEAAESLPQSPALQSIVTEARSAVAAAARPEAAKDPANALATLAEVDSRLDAVLAEVRDQQQRIERAKQRLDGSLASARSAIEQADSFISTRRGAIGES